MSQLLSGKVDLKLKGMVLISWCIDCHQECMICVPVVTQHTSNNFLMLQMKEENTCESPQVRSERELVMITIGLQYQLLFRVQQLHKKTISPTLVWRAVTRRTASQPQWNNL